VFCATKFSDFMEYIIPFFDKYQIIGVKSENYQDLKKSCPIDGKEGSLNNGRVRGYS